MSNNVKALVFDLGGVLVDFAGLSALVELTDGRMSEQEVLVKFRQSTILDQLERGRCSPEEFAEVFLADWSLDLEVEDFLSQFSLWPRAAFDGAHQLLERHRSDYTLACLSNINVLHWRRHQEAFNIAHLFHHAFLSHEIGLRKPDPEVYTHVSKVLELPPEQIAFFDDSEANVDVALAHGLKAYQVDGLPALAEILTAL